MTKSRLFALLVIFAINATLESFSQETRNESQNLNGQDVKELRKQFYDAEQKLRLLEDSTKAYAPWDFQPKKIVIINEIYGHYKLFSNTEIPYWIPLIQYLTKKEFGVENNSLRKGLHDYLIKKAQESLNQEAKYIYQGKCIKYISGVCYSYLYKIEDTHLHSTVLCNLIYDIKNKKVLTAHDIFNKGTLDSLNIAEDSLEYLDFAFNGERLVYGMNNTTPKWQKIIETKSSTHLFTKSFNLLLNRVDTVFNLQQKINNVKDSILVLKELIISTSSPHISSFYLNDESPQKGIHLYKSNDKYYVSGLNKEITNLTEKELNKLSKDIKNDIKIIKSYLNQTSETNSSNYIYNENEDITAPIYTFSKEIDLNPIYLFNKEIGSNAINALKTIKDFSISFIIEPDGTISAPVIEEIRFNSNTIINQEPNTESFKKEQNSLLKLIKKVIPTIRKSKALFPGQKDDRNIRVKVTKKITASSEWQ